MFGGVERPVAPRSWRSAVRRAVSVASWGRLGLRARIVVASAVLATAIGTVGVVVTLQQTSQRLRSAAASAPQAPAAAPLSGLGPLLPPSSPSTPDGPPLGTAQEREAEGRVVERVLAASQRRGLFTVGVLAGLSVIAAWLLSARLVRPIRRMTETARSVTSPGSGRRINLVGPNDEVHELAATIDAMLDRLDRSFESQRRFVADASHELRTPLAILRTEVDVTLEDEDASLSTLRSAMVRLGQEVDRTSSLVESLLHLSRAETMIATESHDLAVAAEEALANASRLRVGRRTVEAHLASAPVVGDALLIDRLVSNLVENAFRHSPGDGLIRVVTTMRDGRPTLRIENDGLHLTDDEVGELCGRFRRGAAHRGRGDGHGLGLAIVQTIVETHCAKLTIQARPAGGLTVTVDFASLPPIREPR